MKKLIKHIIICTLCCVFFAENVVSVFASDNIGEISTSDTDLPNEEIQIDSVNELKAEIAENLTNGKLSANETKEIFSNTDEEVFEDFMDEKFDVLEDKMDSNPVEFTVGNEDFSTGSETYTLGDGCYAKVIYEDQQEEDGSLVSQITNAVTNAGNYIDSLVTTDVYAGSKTYDSVNVKYGKRYLTSKLYIFYGTAFFVATVENHYTCLKNHKGLKERYGKAYVSGGGLFTSVKTIGDPWISDKRATKKGTDISIDADFESVLGIDAKEIPLNIKYTTRYRSNITWINNIDGGYTVQLKATDKAI